MPKSVDSWIHKETNPWTPKSNSQRKQIGKPLRNQVWLKYMGNKAQGKCYCCKIRTIHITDFHVGHNKAVARGGKNHISNLRPISNEGWISLSPLEYSNHDINIKGGKNG